VRRAAFRGGAAPLEAVVDPNEPPMPRQITTTRSVDFAKALARGEQDRFTIIKDGIGTRFARSGTRPRWRIDRKHN
jgi:hypothetical protein